MLRKIRKMLKHQEGFTLVELMIVVVILGILAGVGIQQYGKVQQTAKENAHNANVKILTSAANMYIMAENEPETGTFPSSDKPNPLVPHYVQEWPTNPLGESGTGESDRPYTVTIENTNGVYTVEVKPGPVN